MKAQFETTVLLWFVSPGQVGEELRHSPEKRFGRLPNLRTPSCSSSGHFGRRLGSGRVLVLHERMREVFALGCLLDFRCFVVSGYGSPLDPFGSWLHSGQRSLALSEPRASYATVNL